MNKDINKKNIKIIFMGTPEFGATILEKLAGNNYKPILVITAPNKKQGRKNILIPTPVKISAEELGIKIFQPKKLSKKDIFSIKNMSPDLIIVAAYGKILPKEILEIPKYGCLNIHPSLLPKYRGPSPIQSAILNGEKETGTTIILMDEKIDHGKIIASEKLANSIKKTPYKELSKKLAEISAELLIKTIPNWINGKIKPKPQDETKATYTKSIKREDGKINWSDSAERIERKFYAFYPWPGIFTFFEKNGKILRVKILDLEISNKEDKNNFFIKLKKKYLIIKKIQPEGKKPMLAEDFKRGYGNITLLRAKKRDKNNN